MKLSAHTDGASKGNPGPAAIGFTIEKDGYVLEEFCEYIGETTNNIAEYRAFISVLSRMKELGGADITVYTDSELAARQINGIYRVKNQGLKPLYKEVMALLAEFNSYRITHVTRDKNTAADNLANKAIREHRARAKKQ